jgi:hypothetical protein
MASNCVITQGLQLASCVNNVPGVEGIWVLTSTGNTAEFSTITYGTSGSSEGMVISVSGNTSFGLEFKKIDIVRNSSAALNEETSINLESLGFTYNTNLLFTIPGISQSATNLYEQIVQNVESYFIVKLKTGKYFLAGHDGGMFVSTATIASGSLPGDSQLYSIGLTSNGASSVPQMEVNTTLAAFLAGSNITIDRE